jgi:hypothetical protein
MSLRRNKTIDNPMKIPEKKLIDRKVLPLPVLSLQTKGDSIPILQEEKKIKVHKSPIREKFQKMLEILNKPERKSHCIPANFYNNGAKSRELIRRRMKTNFEFYQTKVEHLQLRTDIVNALKKI